MFYKLLKRNLIGTRMSGFPVRPLGAESLDGMKRGRKDVDGVRNCAALGSFDNLGRISQSVKWEVESLAGLGPDSLDRFSNYDPPANRDPALKHAPL